MLNQYQINHWSTLTYDLRGMSSTLRVQLKPHQMPPWSQSQSFVLITFTLLTFNFSLPLLLDYVVILFVFDSQPQISKTNTNYMLKIDKWKVITWARKIVAGLCFELRSHAVWAIVDWRGTGTGTGSNLRTRPTGGAALSPDSPLCKVAINC